MSFKTVVALSACVVFCVPVVAQAGADILSLVPPDAQFIVVGKNLQELSGKVRKLVTAVAPEMAEKAEAINLPAMITAQLFRTQEGLNATGSAAFVITDLSKMDSGEGAVVILPVDDVEKLLANLQPPPKDLSGGKKQLMLSGMGKVVVVKKGSYLLISPGVQSLDKCLTVPKPFSQGISADAKAVFARSDVVMCMDYAKVFAAMEKQIAKHQGAAPMGPMGLMMGGPAAALKGPKTFINQMGWVTVGVAIEPTGVRFLANVDCKPGSDLAKACAALSKLTTDKSLLIGLPAVKYAAAWGIVADYSALVESYSRIFDELCKNEQVATKIDVAVLRQLKDKVLTLMKLLKGQRGFVAAAPAGEGAVSINAAVTCTDAAAVRQTIEEALELLPRLRKLQEAEQPLVTVTVQKAAGKEGDVSYDMVNFAVRTEGQGRNVAAGIAMFMTSIFGQPGGGLRLAQIDNNTLLVSIGSRTHFASTVKALKTSQAGLANIAAIKAAAVTMPKKRFEEMYISVAGLFEVGKTLVATFQPGAEQAFPQAAPAGAEKPITIAASATQTGIQADVFMPVDSIRATVELGKAIFMAGMQPTEQWEQDE